MPNVISRAGAMIAVISFGLTLSACGYNTIPTLEEQAKARWSNVQNQYQRRTDLIPNLVATVQGYAAQEKNVLTAVVALARNSTTMNGALSGGGLFGTASSDRFHWRCRLTTGFPIPFCGRQNTHWT